MAASYPKSPELQAFEDWARDKTWFKKTKGHFGRNCNDTCYTHYTVNDRANAFLAGVKHAHLTRPAQAVDVGAIRDVIADMENTIEVWPTDLTRWNKLLTAALPNANGKEDTDAAR